MARIRIHVPVRLHVYGACCIANSVKAQWGPARNRLNNSKVRPSGMLTRETAPATVSLFLDTQDQCDVLISACLLGGGGHVGGEDVVGVAVEVLSGSVVAHGGSGSAWRAAIWTSRRSTPASSMG